MNDQIRHYSDKLAYEIDSSDLHALLVGNAKVIVIDARTPEAYAVEHIPGALNVPHRTMNPETAARIDRDALIVTYCDGIGCNASTKGALNMAKLEFKVKELIGGLDWWKRDGYPTSGERGSQGSSEMLCGC
ncbi:MAG TPA: rhodanese-like domain-containing protein [Paucimonas sp.]|nr:rhodanese-like domain-containing protein [Paucimonas sp.]